MTEKAIVICGTPCTGKTTVSLRLANLLDALYINVAEFVKSRKLFIEYDEETKSFIVDEERLSSEIEKVVEGAGKKYVILDTHVVKPLSKISKYLKACFVLRLHPKELIERLEKKYGKDPVKISDNVEAEAIGLVYSEAIEAFGQDKVYQIDVTGKSVDEIIEKIVKCIEHGECSSDYVDWLAHEDVVELLSRIAPTV